MNTELIKQMSKELNISEKSINATLSLLQEGATIPFIARYRKEATGNLDEEQILAISNVYEYGKNLQKRKEDVYRLIDEKDLMTEEISMALKNATKLIEVEDIYRPFKEKKKTKATEAIKLGLEPLAKEILLLPTTGTMEEIASKYLTTDVKTTTEALTGAGYIVAEMVSDNSGYRAYIRNYVFTTGSLETKVKKSHPDEKGVYEIYYAFKALVKNLKSYQILAVNRAENEKIITAGIKVDEEYVLNYLFNKITNNKNSIANNFLREVVKDSYKRLIMPSVEREVRTELTTFADKQAIKVFGDNLENLLLIPPLKEKVILGFDPAFRTGCKLAIVDRQGNFIKKTVIYPHEPKNEKQQSKDTLLGLIKDYNVDIIAIGNGTASRESETFVSEVIKDLPNVSYIIVSEAGASVYSASKLAIEEFPELSVEERSAISIARRVQDALNELVKIDPKSIGVGQYQHDVNQKELTEMLDFTVSKAVNTVGVNINNASKTILKYVSGLNKTYIEKLYKVINSGKQFKSRKEIKKLLSDKVYEQSIGFIRIMNGENILDQTDIHPESYPAVEKLINELNLSLKDINTEVFKKTVELINVTELSTIIGVDKYTLEDIKKSLLKPGRDPRESFDAPVLRKDVLTLDDLKEGMKLTGTVRNVIDFGAFVDIGLKNDGLIHISKLSDNFVNHPSEILSVGDVIEVAVIDINKEKSKVGLSLKKEDLA